MGLEITEERREIANCLERMFAESGLTRRQWASMLGVTRGAIWQWLDCRTVPRPDVWLSLLRCAAEAGVDPEVVEALLASLDVPLGRLGAKQPSRRNATLLGEIVTKASSDLRERVTELPFLDALDVLDEAMSRARRTGRDRDWQENLTERFEHVVGQVVDTALATEDTEIDRARLGAAAWRATYDWALARPDEALDEGQVTRIVNAAVRGFVVESGGSLRSPVY